VRSGNCAVIIGCEDETRPLVGIDDIPCIHLMTRLNTGEIEACDRIGQRI
jgi:hypothetical protein